MKINSPLFKLLVFVSCVLMFYGCPSSSQEVPYTPLETIEDEYIPVDVTFQSEKCKNTSFEWLTPITENANAFDRISIKLRVRSDMPLNAGKFVVLSEGVHLSTKSDEVALLPKGNEYLYSNVINLNRSVPLHVISIGIQDDRGNIVCESDLRFIKITDDIETKLTWVSPNLIKLSGNPYNASNSELKIELNIESTLSNLDKNDINILYNSIDITEKTVFTLNGVGGKKTLSAYIKLYDTGSFQNIYITAIGVPSQKLTINYSPNYDKPNLHVVSIGVKSNLQYSLNDAKDFINLFKNQGGGPNSIYKNINFYELINDAATADGIIRMFSKLPIKFKKTGEIKANDLLLVYISSHGYTEGNDVRIHANNFDNLTPELKKRTSISLKDDLLKQLDEVFCKKIVMVDACHSGQVGKKSLINPVVIDEAIKNLARVSNSTIMLTSSQGNEYSYEDSKWKNGAFTEAVIKGLIHGKADRYPRNNIVTISELFKYIHPEVKKMVMDIKKADQTPQIIPDLSKIQDIPIYVVK